jgi:SAM-dependent methyltransferase
LKRTPLKPAEEIAREWDSIAPTRDTQIATGVDVSYNTVLKPLVLRLLETVDLGNVLDVGCGTGQLTAAVAQIATHVIGIDISATSISIAARNTASCGNVTLDHISLEAFARSARRDFTVAIANMSLSTIPDLKEAVSTLAQLIVPGGHVIATVPHPCFWPEYWGYATADWFDYWSDISIEAQFRISLERSEMSTTHVHRPLATYINAFAECGLQIELLEEPLPTELAQSCDALRSRYPRFLGWRSRLGMRGC